MGLLNRIKSKTAPSEQICHGEVQVVDGDPLSIFSNNFISVIFKNP